MIPEVYELLILYFLYYLGIPGLIIFVVWKMKEKRDFIESMEELNDNKIGAYSDALTDSKKNLKKIQVVFVVLFLMSMPVLNLTGNTLQNISLHSTRDYGSWETDFLAVIDRVGREIGPSFDTDEVIEQLEENKDRWYLEDIQNQISFQEISQVPGTLAVYQLREITSDFERIVITYDYLSPIMITKYIEFIIVEDEAFLEAEKTILYPMPPSFATPSRL
ncbi:MAG: hypothetical protein KGY76_06645 [Candidatus Thermoplasmatota archaeon]|nr:hypothetical protein [Candidatus Thermoplasmatota archaeon]